MEMMLYNCPPAHLDGIKLGKEAGFYLQMRRLNPHKVKKEASVYKRLEDLLEYKKMLMFFPLNKI